MTNSFTNSENYGRYVVNSYLLDHLTRLNKPVQSVYFTQDVYDPADIIYSHPNGTNTAVEVKVRHSEYPTYIYEETKNDRLEKYRSQHYYILYANVVEPNETLYVWNVTNPQKVKGVSYNTITAPSTTCGDNSYIKEKDVYYLPADSAFIKADCSTYINRYKELTNA